MRMISAPRALRATAWLALLCIPMALVEVFIAVQAPSGRPPVRFLEVGLGLSLVLFIPMSLAIRYGRGWALSFTQVIAFAWCPFTLILAERLRKPNLAFYGIFLTFFWIVYLTFLRREFKRSFLDPAVRWFQGMPRAIPGLRCEYMQDGKKVEARVCRLDRDGAFLFRCSENLPARDTDLIFSFGAHQVHCPGTVTREFHAGAGMGFRFDRIRSDEAKELSDFVEVIKGEGYVD